MIRWQWFTEAAVALVVVLIVLVAAGFDVPRFRWLLGAAVVLLAVGVAMAVLERQERGEE